MGKVERDDIALLQQTAAASPAYCRALIIAGRALLAGHDDEVDALLQLQPGSVAWAVQVRRLERLTK